jgi:hypothetical protein
MRRQWNHGQSVVGDAIVRNSILPVCAIVLSALGVRRALAQHTDGQLHYESMLRDTAYYRKNVQDLALHVMCVFHRIIRLRRAPSDRAGNGWFASRTDLGSTLG